MSDDTQGLMKLIELLRPLSTEQRKRSIATALTFLGDSNAISPTSMAGGGDALNGGGDVNLP